MKAQTRTMMLLSALSAVLMSIPWLVPHCGFVALFALVPLLCLERIATLTGIKHIWWWHYGTFVLWNAITTFWVCNATLGGGIFAVLANALQMSVIFAVFRLSRMKLKGVLPYIFLAAMWIAWERWYLVSAQISWPWLVLGNAFARSTHIVQWYEYTGTLGGSLWVWACNLAVFGMMAVLSDGRWASFNAKGKIASLACMVLLFVAPMATSALIYHNYEEVQEDSIDVVIGQPNFDPYHKFTSLTQSQQNAVLLDLYGKELGDSSTSSVMLLAPETFTNDVTCGNLEAGSTWQTMLAFLQKHRGANVLFGASSHEFIQSASAPSLTARCLRDDMWYESHNSALMLDASGRTEIFHKSKLVVGTELTPYPRFFNKIDDMLGGVMARCSGQKDISLLHFAKYDSLGVHKIPVGSIICYESVYPEYCTGYVRKGARALAVITNDAWWGDTPGYRQHFSYSCLRAIELRRDIARCGNTGISGFIDQRGDVVQSTAWWEPAVIRGAVNTNSRMTFFAAHGDMVGRLCTLVFLLMLLLLLRGAILKKTA